MMYVAYTYLFTLKFFPPNILISSITPVAACDASPIDIKNRLQNICFYEAVLITSSVLHEEEVIYQKLLFYVSPQFGQ